MESLDYCCAARLRKDAYIPGGSTPSSADDSMLDLCNEVREFQWESPTCTMTTLYSWPPSEIHFTIADSLLPTVVDASKTKEDCC